MQPFVTKMLLKYVRLFELTFSIFMLVVTFVRINACLCNGV